MFWTLRRTRLALPSARVKQGGSEAKPPSSELSKLRRTARKLGRPTVFGPEVDRGPEEGSDLDGGVGSIAQRAAEAAAGSPRPQDDRPTTQNRRHEAQRGDRHTCG